MSQFQLIPCGQVRDYFADQFGIPVSVGSIFNFNKEAFGLLADFNSLVREKLNGSPLVHTDNKHQRQKILASLRIKQLLNEPLPSPVKRD